MGNWDRKKSEVKLGQVSHQIILKGFSKTPSPRSHQIISSISHCALGLICLSGLQWGAASVSFVLHTSCIFFFFLFLGLFQKIVINPHCMGNPKLLISVERRKKKGKKHKVYRVSWAHMNGCYDMDWFQLSYSRCRVVANGIISNNICGNNLLN